MIMKFLLGSILGGIVLFAWGAISWMVLPWHEQTLEKFSDEPAVAQIIAEQATRDGVYILPNPHKHSAIMNEEQKKAAETDAMERMKQGPFVFLAVTKSGSDPQDQEPYIRSLITQMVIAGLITCLVLAVKLSSYSGKVLFITALGLLGGLMVYVPLWNWWKFSNSFTLVGVADLVISAFLAGLVIAAVTRN
ncbi:MAG: hypothetical protein V3V50_03380 [Gammaproteobacteria bacterium]